MSPDTFDLIFDPFKKRKKIIKIIKISAVILVLSMLIYSFIYSHKKASNLLSQTLILKKLDNSIYSEIPYKELNYSKVNSILDKTEFVSKLNNAKKDLKYLSKNFKWTGISTKLDDVNEDIKSLKTLGLESINNSLKNILYNQNRVKQIRNLNVSSSNPSISSINRAIDKNTKRIVALGNIQRSIQNINNIPLSNHFKRAGLELKSKNISEQINKSQLRKDYLINLLNAEKQARLTQNLNSSNQTHSRSDPLSKVKNLGGEIISKVKSKFFDSSLNAKSRSNKIILNLENTAARSNGPYSIRILIHNTSGNTIQNVNLYLKAPGKMGSEKLETIPYILSNEKKILTYQGNAPRFRRTYPIKARVIWGNGLYKDASSNLRVLN